MFGLWGYLAAGGAPALLVSVLAGLVWTAWKRRQSPAGPAAEPAEGASGD